MEIFWEDEKPLCAFESSRRPTRPLKRSDTFYFWRPILFAKDESWKIYNAQHSNIRNTTQRRNPCRWSLKWLMLWRHFNRVLCTRGPRVNGRQDERRRRKRMRGWCVRFARRVKLLPYLPINGEAARISASFSWHFAYALCYSLFNATAKVTHALSINCRLIICGAFFCGNRVSELFSLESVLFKCRLIL